MRWVKNVPPNIWNRKIENRVIIDKKLILLILNSFVIPTAIKRVLSTELKALRV